MLAWTFISPSNADPSFVFGWTECYRKLGKQNLRVAFFMGKCFTPLFFSAKFPRKMSPLSPYPINFLCDRSTTTWKETLFCQFFFVKICQNSAIIPDCILTAPFQTTELASYLYSLGCRQKIKKIPPLLFGTGLTQKTIWRQFFWRRVLSSLTPRAF